jgi:ubiquinone/menaquinone biosynthesis C-methylase UbiE
MIESKKLREIVDTTIDAVIKSNPSHEKELQLYLTQFRARLLRDLDSISDIFNLCLDVDSEMPSLKRLKSPIREIVVNARNDIQAILISFMSHSLTSDPVLGCDITRIPEIDRDYKLAEALMPAIPIIRKKIPNPRPPNWRFHQRWLQMELNGNGLYERMRDLVTDRNSKTQRWEILKNLLPRDLQSLFEPLSVGGGNEEYLAVFKQYIPLVKFLGKEAVAAYLINTGKVKVRFNDAVRILSKYLGPYQRPKVTPINLSDIPADMVEMPDIRTLLFNLLRNYIYHEMVESKYDLKPAGSQREYLSVIRQKAERVIGEIPQVTGDLLDDVFDYFAKVIDIESPSRMENTITSKGKKNYFLPSLRQKIAMMEMRIGRRKFNKDFDHSSSEGGVRKLVGFFMGKGKTATSFLSKEYVGAKKMLYVCPPNITDEIPKEVERVYKKDGGSMPEVGLITAGKTTKEIDLELQKEIVIVPYSMLRGDIIEQIKGQKFDFMVVDEVHWARKAEGSRTNAVRELACGIPDLYEKGWIMSMSGDPMPNGPDDIVPQLMIADKDRFGDARGLARVVRDNDPLEIRNVIMDYYLLIDSPEEWEDDFVVHVPYSLKPEEREVYEAILMNDTLGLQSKLHHLSLCVVNPSMFIPGETEVESALFEQTVQKVEEYLAGHDAVVIVENMFKHGITRDLKRTFDTASQSFIKRLEKYFKQRFSGQVEIAAYDGDTTPSERVKLIEKSKRTDGKKTIIFTVGGTMREGTNEFAHIHRAVVLEPTFNKADTAQLVKRFARGDNDKVEVALLCAQDTIHEGIAEHADIKYVMTDRIKYGGCITEDDVGYLCNDNFSEEIYRTMDGRLVLGTAILDKILTPGQRLARILARLQGKGVDFWNDVLNDYGDRIAETYMDHWEHGYSGNNARFTVSLFKELENKGFMPGNTYADLASGPLILDRSFSMYDHQRKSRNVYSLDLSRHMIDIGSQNHTPSAQPQVGSITDMKQQFEDGQFDAINIALAIEYTNNNLHIKQPTKSERVQSLIEANRILKPGGIMVITVTTNACSAEQLQKITNVLHSNFGFDVLSDYTGLAVSTDDDLRKFENFTIVCKKIGDIDLKGLNVRDLEMTRRMVSIKGGTNITKKDPVENTGSMHRSFTINDVDLDVDLKPDVAERQEKFDHMYNLSYQLLEQLYRERSMDFDKVTVEQRSALREKYGIIFYCIEEETSSSSGNTGKKKSKTTTAKKYYFALTLDPSKVFPCDFCN